MEALSPDALVFAGSVWRILGFAVLVVVTGVVG